MKIFITNVIRPLVILLFTMGFISSFAQSTYLTLTGSVKDRKTGEPVSYASVTVPGTGVGTVTNSDGEFILKISSKINSEYFELSHLSYATSQYRIKEATGEAKVYFLDVLPVELKEIPVIPQDARALVEAAFANVSKNYSEVPNMMTGFYREYVMQRRDYLSISEAVVDIYKAPYFGIQDDQVKIFKGRKASNVKKADTLLVNLQGGPKVLLLLDIVKQPDLSISMDNLDHYVFEFGSVVNIDDKQHWVVEFSPNPVAEGGPYYFGKLYISMDSKAITRAEFSLDLRDMTLASEMFVKKKPAGLIFNPTSTSYLVTYKQQGEKYYLSYVRVDIKFRCDWKKKLFKNSYSIMSEAAITGRSTDNIVKFGSDETFKSNMVFAEKVEDFADEDFWGENNIIQPEESIENAVKKLSREMK